MRVANKDRLCRFAYDLVEHILEKHGAKIIVEAHDTHSTEQELAEDVLSVITVFGARLYGSRSGRKRRKEKQQEAKNISGGETVGCGEQNGGTDEAEDAIQEDGSFKWASADLQGADAPDADAGPGAEAVFLSRQTRVQSNAGANKKRRTGELHKSAKSIQGGTATGMGNR